MRHRELPGCREHQSTLKTDACLMASVNRAIVEYEASMKALFPVLMLALSLITSAARARIP